MDQPPRHQEQPAIALDDLSPIVQQYIQAEISLRNPNLPVQARLALRQANLARLETIYHDDALEQELEHVGASLLQRAQAHCRGR